MNKILFSSLCIGELYLNWAVICVRSFINACSVLTTPITWEFCTTEEFEELLKKRLEHLNINNLQFIFTRISVIDKSIDYTKTNVFRFHKNDISKIFYWRIKHINDLKEEQKYNILVTVDLDSVFISNPFDKISEFITNDKTMCGTSQYMNLNELYKNLKNYDIKKDVSLFPKTYINLGFAFLNLDKLPNNIYNYFKKIFPGNEYIFCTEDETFFNILVKDAEKEFTTIQLVSHAWKFSDVDSKDIKIVHFSPNSVDLLGKLTFKEINYPLFIKTCYFDVLKSCADYEKEYIDENVLHNIHKNSKIFERLKHCLTKFKKTQKLKL